MSPSRARTPRVVIIGAGFAGIGMAMRLARAGIRSFTLLERGDGVGGTWRENTYPGAACDIPSHLYSFSFAPATHWSRTYAEQPEILAYLQRCAREYGLIDHLRFGVEVAAAVFDGERNLWDVRASGGERFEADVVISAVGQLNRPSLPAIPGRESFAGPAFHSARWRHDVELGGKRVAVIGTGASAVQFVPRIAPLAASLAIFQRSAPYVLPKADRAYSARARKLFATWPLLQRGSRALKYWRQEVNVIAFSYVRALGRVVEGGFHASLGRQIADAGLRERLRPAYAVGCKRVLLANDYYATLARPNVELVTESIERIVPGGIVTHDGRERPFDAIVYATGFAAAAFLAPMHVTGREGRTLGEAWSAGVHALFGIATSGFPNFFMLYGPNTNLGHNSIVYMLEAQFDYVLDAVELLARGGATRLEVRPEREAAFNARLQARLDKSVWASGCDSWYLDRNGKNVNNWPDFTFAYRARTRRLDPADYLPVGV